MMELARFVALALALFFTPSVVAYPSEFLNGRSDASALKGRKIVPPPIPTSTGLKKIPDAEHPFRAPGPGDQRGPCPGLNTMANHGYIPRNGIVSFEDIVNGATEAFNMEYHLVSALAAFGTLARGNAFLGLISIGGPVQQIPALPGNVDGPLVRGLATHGRFEGDVSMTRQDAAIGDNRNFNQSLFDELLADVKKFGNDSDVTGPGSVVTVKVMQEFKFNRFVEDQLANRQLEYHEPRFTLSYGESSFTLNLFANGTDGILSVPTMTSFFKFQRFPENWHRRSSPADINFIGIDAEAVIEGHPISPGANDANGNFVVDTTVDDCALYDGVLANIPGSLVNTTGVFNANVNTLLDAIFAVFSDGSACVKHDPSGQAGV